MNNTVLKKAIFNLIGVAGVAALSSSLQAASFDCVKAAKNIEKMICANGSLSSLDDQLSIAYKKAFETASDKRSLRQEQLSWLKKRNTCEDVACLSQSYQSRIALLDKNTNAIPTTDVPKKIITFNLIEGEDYPLCKEYVDMLNKTHYTEIPACSRKILSEANSFKEVSWIDMTDKTLIKTVLEERSAVLIALNPTVSKQTFSPHNTIKRIYDDKSKMSSYNLMLDGDDVMDTVYRIQEYSNFNRRVKHGYCETYSNFYFDDSLIKLDSINQFTIDPYRSFNLTGNEELFLYGDRLYVSSYEGNAFYRTNLNVYGIGNKKICGILAK